MLFGCITLCGVALADPTGGMGMPLGGMMESGKDMRGEMMGSGMGHGMMMSRGMGHGMMMGGCGGDEAHYARMPSLHMLGALGLKDDPRKKVMDLRRVLRFFSWVLLCLVFVLRVLLGLFFFLFC